ncbi:MAG TPA: phosphoenolpyruvate--protein phosphotransferase [Roseiflexaceae bacterium]|nr:phosphoenolpyruvate--protein phosphotransferase [Roseiflexaceae bacterium]
MIQLTAANIQLHSRATTKEEAIRQAGRLLVENGNIAPGYIESMLGRELQANTFLGNGIAIPHGMAKDRELIQRTGIAVLQVPGGVTWNPGETVRLLVAIAARSDEHLGILARLMEVLDNPALAERLARTDDPAEILASLSRPGDSAGADGAAAQHPDAHATEVRIHNAGGLHARPATAFVEVAQGFVAEIRVEHGGKQANGKSLASLLRLGAASGAPLRIVAWGADADAALAALRDAVERGLEEEDEHPAPAAGDAWKPVSGGRAIAGVAAAPGLAIGPVFLFQAQRIVVEDRSRGAEAEHRRLHDALVGARLQLDALYESVRQRSGKNEAAIFRAHQALLDDPELIVEVEGQIGAGRSAAWAWNGAVERRAAELRQVGDERLAGRAVDLHDVGQRVLRLLAHLDQAEPALPPDPVIVLADDLTPSDTARLDPKRTLGICTAGGGPTSHTAIIARSLDIPAVVGAGAALLELPVGTVCVLDGAGGTLYVEPDQADLASAQQFQRDLAHQRDAEYETRYEPALMTDGHRIEVVANIGKAAEAAQAVEAGAEGVGLLRTEFLFLERDRAPTEEEQFQAYTAMTSALNGLPLIIRTLDIGGDKVVPYLNLPREENPFLGVRGVRLCLRHPELFLPQLRAIYRAAATGPIKIMFPMIATLEDLRAARAAAEQVRAELDAPPVEIGIMVEVPSTVIMAEEFAREVDFFSIGTNDLTQYAMAIDRQHPVLASQADGLHPAVLRLIDQTVRAAEAAGKWVGVCGGIAGDPHGAVILAGLGVAELSMSIPSVAAVKARLRLLSRAQARAVASKALACSTAAEVRRLAQ